MNTFGNLYAVLGVGRDASGAEIRHAYRQLVRQYHPDIHAGDPMAHEMLKAINVAAEVLCDPARRASYDHELADAQRRTLLRDHRAAGHDVEYTVTITEVEARTGTERMLCFHGPDGQPRNIHVTIPPGTQPGTQLCIPGAGEPSCDGTRHGDLFVIVQLGAQVTPEPSFSAPMPLSQRFCCWLKFDG